MTVRKNKAEILAVVRHLKGCLSRLQQVSDFISGDEYEPEFQSLIDTEMLDCNARLDVILREVSAPVD